MPKEEIYVSVDIESDGPIPGINSMLNFGAAAFRYPSEEPIAKFERNLERLSNASSDQDTMENFWDKNPEAWAYVRTDPQDPATAMREFNEWLRGLPGIPVQVTYPTWDYMWIRWYMVRFLGHQESQTFGLSCLDTKTLAMAALNHPTFKNTSKRTFEKKRPDWLRGHPPHDHTGLSDAIGQGILFIRILKAIRELHGKVGE